MDYLKWQLKVTLTMQGLVLKENMRTVIMNTIVPGILIILKPQNILIYYLMEQQECLHG